MATAKQAGGLYYVGDTAVDADGKAIKGAPKRPKDTDPSKQPGAFGAPTPEERMGLAIANALQGKTSASAASSDETDENDEDEQLPTLAELPDHLAGLKSIEDVQALQEQDERKGAVALYEARIAELEEK